jgi:hypothetical protein
LCLLFRLFYFLFVILLFFVRILIIIFITTRVRIRIRIKLFIKLFLWSLTMLCRFKRRILLFDNYLFTFDDFEYKWPFIFIYCHILFFKFYFYWFHFCYGINWTTLIIFSILTQVFIYLLLLLNIAGISLLFRIRLCTTTTECCLSRVINLLLLRKSCISGWALASSLEFFSLRWLIYKNQPICLDYKMWYWKVLPKNIKNFFYFLKIELF